MVVLVCNPSTRELKTGGSGVQGHPWSHSQFMTNMGYMSSWVLCKTGQLCDMWGQCSQLSNWRPSELGAMFQVQGLLRAACQETDSTREVEMKASHVTCPNPKVLQEQGEQLYSSVHRRAQSPKRFNSEPYTMPLHILSMPRKVP